VTERQSSITSTLIPSVSAAVHTNSTNSVVRGERHPSTEPNSGSSNDNPGTQNHQQIAIDTATLTRIFQNLLNSANNLAPATGSSQYLLPVDLIVSVDHTAKATVQAAIPSSFALNPLTFANQSYQSSQPQPQPPSFSTDFAIANPNFPSSSKSMLNPSAATFQPDQCDQLNQLNLGETPWTELDEIDEEPERDFEHKESSMTPFRTIMREVPSTPKTPKRLITNKIKATTPRESSSNSSSWRGYRPRTPQTLCYGCSHNLSVPSMHYVKAEFVSHVTLRSRGEYPPDTVLTKTWRMRNSGCVDWGYDVFLVYVKGDAALTMSRRYPVPSAAPGEEIEVSATLRTGQRSGRMCTYFRLFKKGRLFGPRVWADLIVTGGVEGVADSKCRENNMKWRKKGVAYAPPMVSCQ